MQRSRGALVPMVLGVLLLVMPSARAQPAPGQQPPGPAQVLAQMHMLNELVIRASDLALKRAQNGGVRAWAVRLKEDHQLADRMVESTGAQLHVDVNGTAAQMKQKMQQMQQTMSAGQGSADAMQQMQPPPAMQKMMQLQQQTMQLGQLSGAAFDQRFVMIMGDAHEMAVGMLSKAKASTRLAPLEGLLTKMIPILRQHVALAHVLEKRVG